MLSTDRGLGEATPTCYPPGMHGALATPPIAALTTDGTLSHGYACRGQLELQLGTASHPP